MPPRAGYDFIIQGMGGLMALTGEPDGRAAEGRRRRSPTSSPASMRRSRSSPRCAAREATGAGCHIDMALLDTQVAVLANQAMNYLVVGEAPHRLGNAHPNIVPYQAFAVADGHVIIAVGNDAPVRAALRPARRWPTTTRFATNAGAGRATAPRSIAAARAGASRVRRRDELLAALEARRHPGRADQRRRRRSSPIRR